LKSFISLSIKTKITASNHHHYTSMAKISRRDSLKTLAISGLGAGMLVGCDDKKAEESVQAGGHDHAHLAQNTGLNERDQKLMQQKFFTEHERKTVKMLADIIIPKDERSGSASDAGVPEFIEFMMIDQPQQQLTVRGGLKWLDVQCNKRFEKNFVDCTENQQFEILDEIAYPEVAKPEMSQGVAFFTHFRGLVASGFWSSKIGMKDIGFMGNVANVWVGAPKEFLDKLGVSYES
jgi:hypothetical protein